MITPVFMRISTQNNEEPSFNHSLEEAAVLLDAESTGNFEVIETCFKKRLEEVRLEIGQLQKIEGILQGACKSDGKVMEIFKMSVTEPVIKEIPELQVLSKREKEFMQ